MQAKMIEDLNREIELVKIAKAIERSEVSQLWQNLNQSESEWKDKRQMNLGPIKSLTSFGTPQIQNSSKMTIPNMPSAKKRSKQKSITGALKINK